MFGLSSDARAAGIVRDLSICCQFAQIGKLGCYFVLLVVVVDMALPRTRNGMNSVLRCPPCNAGRGEQTDDEQESRGGFRDGVDVEKGTGFCQVDWGRSKDHLLIEVVEFVDDLEHVDRGN